MMFGSPGDTLPPEAINNPDKYLKPGDILGTKFVGG